MSTDLNDLSTTAVETLSDDAIPRVLPTGPTPGVEYPLTVHYCGICSLPLEYCQYYPTYEKCKAWLEANLPDEFNKLDLDNEQGDGKTKGRQKRGGKGIIKAKKKNVNKKVQLFRSNRGKKKFVIVIRGLSTFDVNLKNAAKLFASKFACGSSVTDVDEIVVQGDVKEELIDLILEKWSEIDEDSIEDIGDKKY